MEEVRDQRTFYDRIIISPDNIYYKIFKAVIINLCLLSSFIYAFWAAYRHDVEKSKPNAKELSGFTDYDIWVFDILQACIEGLFLIDMMIEFILEFIDEEKQVPIRDIQKIGMRYLHNDFASDFIPIIPWNWIVDYKHTRLLFLIKCYRLKETFELLDTGRFMKNIKSFYDNKLKDACNDPYLANNILLDNNKIDDITMIRQIFNNIKLCFIIFLVSYMIGIFFYIFCDLNSEGLDLVSYNPKDPDYFL